MKKEISEMNLFMMCKDLNKSAFSDMPSDYNVRTCRKNELDVWKRIHFDDPKSAEEYYDYMTQYFSDNYAHQKDLFFQSCLFVCDRNDTPVGTCFVWKSYGSINTIHWFKVLKSYEGKGIGRALLSIVMKNLSQNDFPVYLHTQPTSFRAIKLYSDFGFCLLTDNVIGNRQNDLEECLPILEASMNDQNFTKLKFTKAPAYFLDIVASSEIDQF